MKNQKVAGVGIVFCHTCEYKLRCEECAAKDAYKRLRDMKSCNDCRAEECDYRPDWGDLVRYNCPFWGKGYRLTDESKLP